MTAANPLRPLPPDRFDAAAARHLASRAGFGATPAEIRALVDMGLAKAVAFFVEPTAAVAGEEPRWDATLMRPSAEEMRLEREARMRGDEATIARIQRERDRRERLDREQIEAMRADWITRCIETGRPLEEKMTLFWHGHFATGYRTVSDSWLLHRQNQLFRAHALGRFDRLAAGAIRDPALIRYLDNDRNRRGQPNENLARELLELFTMGEGRGYGERDIKEAARALTGYTYQGDEFLFRSEVHDDGVKSILGKSGRFDGDGLLAVVLARREPSEFLCGKLHRFFVDDAPGGPSSEQTEFIKALARELRGADYDIRPVLGTLFRSAHFHDERHRGAIVKSPVQLLVQTIRGLGAPRRSTRALVEATRLLGQDLFEPPNVKGWDGGRAWINTATLFLRQNVAVHLLTGRGAERHGWPADDTPFDATRLLDDLREAAGREALDDPELVAGVLLRHALATPPSADREDAIAGFLARTAGAPLNDRIVGALALIAALPEYQVS